jgi:hypothetical protein
MHKEWCVMKRILCMRLGREGNVLVVTLLILFAVSIMGATLAMVSSMDLKVSGNQRKTSQALFVAEAGLNEAIHRISLPDPTSITVGGWTGNAAIADTEPYDPNWTTMIYLTSPASAPAGGGSINTTGTLQDLSQPHLEYSRPDGTDGVITIRHKWRDLDGDGSRDADEIVRYDPMAVPPENFSSGYPIEVVTVAGRSANGERVIQAEVTRKTTVVRSLGALFVDKSVRLTGNSAFCGFDHDINTPPGTKPDQWSTCAGFHLSGGHLPGVTATGDQIKTQGSADVRGEPVPINNAATNPFYSLDEVLGLSQIETNKLLERADNNNIVQPLNGITYINGDATINSNLTGEGLVYITGDLQAAGSFIFKGLIYVEGDVHFTGSPWILGSMIVRGTSDFNFSSGNAAILYSSEALAMAVNRAMPSLVLSWREM